MGIQYDTQVDWDADLIDLEYTDIDNPLVKGLVYFAIKITTGAPVATVGKFNKGCQIQNAFDGAWYENTGTTAAPTWSLVPSSGSGITQLHDDVVAGPGVGNQSAEVQGIRSVPVLAALDDYGSSYVKINGGIANTNGAVSGDNSNYYESAFIVGASKFTTAGGAPSEDFTIHNIDANSGIIATLNDSGSNNVSIVSADYSAADTVTVVFSADPGNDAVVTIMATRLTSYLD